MSYSLTNQKHNIINEVNQLKIGIFFIIAMLFSYVILAQEMRISGIVSDIDGPLPGANVLVKGTTNGVLTDFDGKYSIKADKDDILVFSYIGYITKEIKVKSKSVINITLEVDSQQLAEVVVVGYATQTRTDVTGSVATIKPGLFSRRGRKKNKHSVSNAYMGKVSGVQVEYKNNESYKEINENTFKRVSLSPLSTFSIDVDKASYSNVRRMINNGEKIPEDAVKIEEMINYFDYNYPQPKDEHPFSINTEVAVTPWNNDTKLVRIGLQGKEFENEALPASNLTFLIDVSGSMSNQNKLPLLKSAFKLLVNQLRNKDKVTIVVYAGAAGMVLKPTSGDDKQTIIEALDNLHAGGSTAGGAGIELAYKIAQENFIKNGNNRVILATDGDFNVGSSSDKAMEDLIEEKRKSGVFLSVLGFGMGNYKDSKLEALADKGNGNHAYIDTMQEANKVFGKEFGGTLFTIAKDVKIQIEFNPTKVQAYRLIGYENRLLNDEDFKDDTKDAGELGSGHTVTALYEIIPIGVKSKFLKNIDDLKYTKSMAVTSHSEELFTVKFRYKKPNEEKSIEMIHIQNDELIKMSSDFSFTASVALFGMQLKKSKFDNKSSVNDVIILAEKGRGVDKQGYRAEFIRLLKLNSSL